MAKFTISYQEDENDDSTATVLSTTKEVFYVEDFFRQVLTLYEEATFVNTICVSIYQPDGKVKMLAIDPTKDKAIHTLHSSNAGSI